MKKTEKGTEKKEQIIRALYECLAERGQEKVSIKNIAEKASLPHGVIHYYFRSKDDIVTALGESIVETLISQMEEKLNNMNPENDMPVIIDFIVEALVIDRKLGRVFYNLIQMTFERESLHGVIAKMFKSYREQLSSFFHNIGFGDGSEHMGTVLVAIIEGIGLQSMIDPDSFSEKKIRMMLENTIPAILSVKI